MKKFLIAAFLFCMISGSFSACGKIYTCMECETTTSKAYYDMNCKTERVMCEACARKYWMPINYETYRVK